MKIELELFVLDGHDKVTLQQTLLADLLVHFRLEETDGAALFRLGTVEREIGMGDQAFGIPAILRIDGNADATADANRLPVDCQHVVEHRRQSRREIIHSLRLGTKMGDDGKDIAAWPRQECAIACSGQPLGDFGQYSVAHCLAEHFVDLTKAIDIDADHGERAMSCRCLAEHPLEIFIEGDAVRQIRDRIVARQMHDTRFAQLAVGDIGMDHHPAAAVHRTIAHLDGTSVGQFGGLARRLALGDGCFELRIVAFLIGEQHTDLATQRHDLCHGGPERHLLRRNVIHADIALVPQLKPALRVIHAEALPHIVERGVKLHVALAHAATAALVGYGNNEAGDDHGDREGSDRQRQFDGRQQALIAVDTGLVCEIDRAHGNEVMHADRQRQQQCSTK